MVIWYLPRKSRLFTRAFDYIVVGVGTVGCVLANRSDRLRSPSRSPVGSRRARPQDLDSQRASCADLLARASIEIAFSHEGRAGNRMIRMSVGKPTLR